MLGRRFYYASILKWYGAESYFFAERNADGIRVNGDSIARKDGTTSFW